MTLMLRSCIDDSIVPPGALETTLWLLKLEGSLFARLSSASLPLESWGR